MEVPSCFMKQKLPSRIVAAQFVTFLCARAERVLLLQRGRSTERAAER